MKNLIFIFFLILCFTLCSCKNEPKFEKQKKVVLNKKISNNIHMIAFTDGSDCKVSYGIYELVEKGDTIIFKCVEGLSFNIWNCGFVEVNKPINSNKNYK